MQVLAAVAHVPEPLSARAVDEAVPVSETSMAGVLAEQLVLSVLGLVDSY